MKQINFNLDLKIIELYTKDNLNCKQIAKLLNINASTCERALKRNNIVLDRYKNRRKINKLINE